MDTALDLILHLDHHLVALTQAAGAWTYVILFAIVFCETGLVVTPFLPGDSLLFTVGAIAASGGLDPAAAAVLLAIAAITGDSVNYWIGNVVGPRVFRQEDSRWLDRRHLDRTREFFERYGAKTIVIARFVPIVRTFAPFVAGIGRMAYRRFFFYNVAGGIAWVGGLVGAGYWFGNLPAVRENFSLVILMIIVLSILPAIVEALRTRVRPPRPAAGV
ncbi:MAG: rane-associated protein [Candidatus Binatota bacterium]|nr:rane-associated protein [Candidatus Binatota bacterium]